MFIAGIKISIGDNQTLGTLFKTFVESLSRRGTEYGIYDLLMHYTPADDSALGKIIKLTSIYSKLAQQ